MKKLLLALLFALPGYGSYFPQTSIIDPNSTNLARVTAAGNLGVDGSGVTQPVSGSLGRTWSLLNSTDSVNVGNFPSLFGATQSGVWSVGRTWSLSHSTDSIASWLFDGTGNSLSSTSGSLNVNITGGGSSNINVAQFGGSNVVTGTGVSGAGIPRVTVSSDSSLSITGTVPLPTGAATSANQTNGNQETQIVQGGNTAIVTAAGAQKVDGSAVTQPVSAASLPLPTGAATSANQTNGTQVTQVSSLPALSAGSNNIGSITNITGTVSLPTGAATSANQTTGNTSLSSILANQTNGTQTTSLLAGSAAIGTVAPNPDSQPATQNVTVVDSVSTSATGANNQKFVTGTPTTGSAASFAISTLDTVRVQVTGTWTGTLVTEVSMDGTNWFTNGIKQTGTSQSASSFTANFTGQMNVTGFTNVRVRATAAVTGTAVVLIAKSYNTSAINILSTVKPEDTQGSGSITSTTPVSIGSSGAGTLMLTVTGTWSGSIQLLGGGSLGATTGTQLWFRNVGGNDVNSFTANSTYCIDTAGFPAIVINPATFTSGTLNYTYDLGVGANKSCGSGAQAVSLGNNNKTAVQKAGNISTTAVTANQTILTYTVTSGKTLYLEYFDCSANTEAAAVTAAAFGSCSLSIGGTVMYTQYYHGSGSSGPFPVTLTEPIPIASGTVISLITTPAAVTAFFWYANFGGYER